MLRVEKELVIAVSIKGFRDNEFAELPNRHEKLFLFGRDGKTFARVTLQMFYLLSIVFLSSYIVFDANTYYKEYKESSKSSFVLVMLAMVICPLLMVLIWLVFIPQILSKFTIITNVILLL